MSRLFDNRLETIVLELVQNARRSGATQIRIGICPPPAASDARSSAVPIEIGIEDDGTGIADPAVVLAFGASGWDAATVRAEDAAGMGIACLASTGCTIRSATASGNGWKTTLEPAHFTGERTAEIDAAPKTERGTRIAFVRTVDTTALGAHATRIRHIRNACANIARDLRETLRHYPLPITVCVQHDPRAEPTVTAMTPEDFLAAAQHRATVNGIRFGVFRKRHGAHPHADQLNLHGLKVAVTLPSIKERNGTIWSVAADAVASPDIQLVLPARTRAVENDALRRLGDDARMVLYRSVAECHANGVPVDPTARDHAAASALGIDFPEPARQLRALTAGLDGSPERLPEAPVRIAPNRVFPTLVDAICHDDSPAAARFVIGDHRAAGHPWYDALPMVADIDCELQFGDRTVDLKDRDDPDDLPDRPHGLAYRLRIEHPGGANETVRFSARVHFLKRTRSKFAEGDMGAILPERTALTPDELATLATDTYFDPDEGLDTEPVDVQRRHCRTGFLATARQHLLGAHAALAAALETHARDRLAAMLPPGATATIRIRRPDYGQAAAVAVEVDAVLPSAG